MAVAALVEQLSDSETITDFINETGITYPVIPEGNEIIKNYGLIENTVIVLDTNGVINFIDAAGTLFNFLRVDEMIVNSIAAATALLEGASVRFPFTRISPAFGAAGITTNVPVTLDGRKVADRGHVACRLTIGTDRYGYRRVLNITK